MSFSRGPHRESRLRVVARSRNSEPVNGNWERTKNLTGVIGAEWAITSAPPTLDETAAEQRTSVRARRGEVTAAIGA